MEYVIEKKIPDFDSTTPDYLKASSIDTSETRKLINGLRDLKSMFSLDNIVTDVGWYDRKDVISQNHEFPKSHTKEKVLTKIKTRLNEEEITKIRSCVIKDRKDGVKSLSAPGGCRKKGEPSIR